MNDIRNRIDHLHEIILFYNNYSAHQSLEGFLDSGVAADGVTGEEMDFDAVSYRGIEIDPYEVHLHWINDDGEEIAVISLMECMDIDVPIDPDTDEELLFDYVTIPNI